MGPLVGPLVKHDALRSARWLLVCQRHGLVETVSIRSTKVPNLLDCSRVLILGLKILVDRRMRWRATDHWLALLLGSPRPQEARVLGFDLRLEVH